MTEQLVRPVTMREVQAMSGHIYTKANERYSDSDIVLRFLEEVCALEEIARKDKRNGNDIVRQVARVYSWRNAVANRFKIDLQEAHWYKYPDVCPWCLKRPGCVCGPEHPEIPDEERERCLRMLRRETQFMPELLTVHQAFHDRLYGWQNNLRLPIQIAAHVAEEAGEVSKEARHGNLEGMADELADSGSWLFAIANRYDFEIADAVWNLYPYECEKCHKTVCQCECSDPPETRETRSDTMGEA